MNNAVYGKQMENGRNRCGLKLIINQLTLFDIYIYIIKIRTIIDNIIVHTNVIKKKIILKLHFFFKLSRKNGNDIFF